MSDEFRHSLNPNNTGFGLDAGRQCDTRPSEYLRSERQEERPESRDHSRSDSLRTGDGDRRSAPDDESDVGNGAVCFVFLLAAVLMWKYSESVNVNLRWFATFIAVSSVIYYWKQLLKFTVGIVVFILLMGIILAYHGMIKIKPIQQGAKDAPNVASAGDEAAVVPAIANNNAKDETKVDDRGKQAAKPETQPAKIRRPEQIEDVEKSLNDADQKKREDDERKKDLNVRKEREEEQKKKEERAQSDRKARLSAIRTLENSGKFDSALRFARELVKLYPKTPEAKEAQAIIDRLSR